MEKQYHVDGSAIARDGSDTNTEMELFHLQRQPKQLFNLIIVFRKHN